MTRTDILRKIEGVRGLAERGSTEEERQAAAYMLDKLMKEHSISEDELAHDKQEVRYLGYSDFVEERILEQVIYMVLGDTQLYEKTRNGKPTRHKRTGFMCTAAEYLEVELTYEFFLRAVKEELTLFFHAFAHKNHMFPPPEKLKEKSEGKKLDEETLKRMKAMMKGMEVHTRHEMLEA